MPPRPLVGWRGGRLSFVGVGVFFVQPVPLAEDVGGGACLFLGVLVFGRP